MKKLTYKARKETDGGIFHIPNRKVMEDDLRRLPKGNYTLTIEKYRKKASTLQFGWLYGSIYKQALYALNDAGYEFTTVDQVDMFFKSLFASKELLIRETGEIRHIPVSKSEFVTIDHIAFVSNIRDYCQEYLNTYITDPDPNWREKIKWETNKICR